MHRSLSVCLLTASLAGCVTTSEFLSNFGIGGPYPVDIGGSNLQSPPVENYRGLPVVQVTFVANASAIAESAFLTDFREELITEELVTTNEGEDPVPAPLADYGTASTNLKAMFAKNVFYAIHLAKFLKIKSDGDFLVILNPVSLGYNSTKGYDYEPFEQNMPAADVEVFFSAYVHPKTKPSTKGSLLTTYGESLAPIISIRVDPAFNPEVHGAMALTRKLDAFASNPQNQGARAQLIDLLNARRYGAKPLQLAEKRKGSGEFEKGKYFQLSFNMNDLEKVAIPEEIIPANQLSGYDYSPGTYYAYKFYDAYYKVVLSALGVVDNRNVVTAAQMNYWTFYDQSGATNFESVILRKSDRRKRRFLLKAKQIELQYLEDRDEKWMNLLLSTNQFKENFSELRNAEQKARDDYVGTQVQAGFGVLLAIAGAAAAVQSSRNDNNYGTAGGGALMGVGIGMVATAMAEMEEIDVAFGTAFESAYDSQKSYVFEIAEGEKVHVRAKDYAGFKNQLKKRFNLRFKPAS